MIKRRNFDKSSTHAKNIKHTLELLLAVLNNATQTVLSLMSGRTRKGYLAPRGVYHDSTQHCLSGGHGVQFSRLPVNVMGTGGGSLPNPAGKALDNFLRSFFPPVSVPRLMLLYKHSWCPFAHCIREEFNLVGILAHGVQSNIRSTEMDRLKGTPHHTYNFLNLGFKVFDFSSGFNLFKQDNYV